MVGDVLHPGTRPKSRVAPHDAEDLLQDALLLFVERHESIQPRSWRAWILGTLRNRERELFKRQALWKKYEPLLEAHVRDYGPWCAEPDAAIRQQQVLFALAWLLEQVAPSRRVVAERYLFEAVPLETIAEETGLPLGTVRSRWARARADMRAALDRERAKLDGVFLAIMLAILGAWCLWIADHVRRGAGAVSTAFGPKAAPAWRPSSRRAARGQRWPRTAAVCAVLPLVVLSHVAIEALPSAEAATLADAIETPAARGDLLVLTPFLTTNAEREREAGALHAVARLVPAAGASAGSVASTSGSDLKLGRALLDRANVALQHGHESVARDALQLYDADFPDNPFPALRAQVAAALTSQRSP